MCFFFFQRIKSFHFIHNFLLLIVCSESFHLPYTVNLQNIVVQFLQSVLADGIIKEYPLAVNSYVEQLSSILVNHDGVELGNNPVCSLQGRTSTMHMFIIKIY